MRPSIFVLFIYIYAVCACESEEHRAHINYLSSKDISSSTSYTNVPFSQFITGFAGWSIWFSWLWQAQHPTALFTSINSSCLLCFFWSNIKWETLTTYTQIHNSTNGRKIVASSLGNKKSDRQETKRTEVFQKRKANNYNTEKNKSKERQNEKITTTTSSSRNTQHKGINTTNQNQISILNKQTR